MASPSWDSTRTSASKPRRRSRRKVAVRAALAREARSDLERRRVRLRDHLFAARPHSARRDDAGAATGQGGVRDVACERPIPAAARSEGADRRQRSDHHGRRRCDRRWRRPRHVQPERVRRVRRDDERRPVHGKSHGRHGHPRSCRDCPRPVRVVIVGPAASATPSVLDRPRRGRPSRRTRSARNSQRDAVCGRWPRSAPRSASSRSKSRASTSSGQRRHPDRRLRRPGQPWRS